MIQSPNNKMKLIGGIVTTMRSPNIQITKYARIGRMRMTIDESNFSGKIFLGDNSSK